ncbi:2-acyl-glycerophospho-ethanolamine acyltransferase [Thiorhodovibrio winogradskyi]|uniref:2-acyl-glycerophospho-ethanolamine acyltransferase n=1 Tax=Thiorhodovibrio winogradskyi TaxID=77007 RepID=A0ABZ0SEW7_9GAMM|nr:lysophospholipid acyltransferase family protein [Thiorhodovibrio winogradskyi]
MILKNGKDRTYHFFRWVFDSRRRTDALYHAVYLPVRLLFGLIVRGAENLPSTGPAIFAFNHGSHYDGFFMMFALYRFRPYPRALPVYWHGMLSMPVISSFLRAHGGFSISHDASQAQTRTGEVIAMRNALESGIPILMAPEGKRNSRLGRFQQGAAMLSLNTGCPIVPCSLRGVNKLYDQLPFPNRICGRVEVCFHPPIIPSGPVTEQPDMLTVKSLTQSLWKVIASGIDYPVATELMD